MNKYIKESPVTILDVLTMVFLNLFHYVSPSLTAEVSVIIPLSVGDWGGSYKGEARAVMFIGNEVGKGEEIFKEWFR